ncbi:MAG: Stp1/IreP family PP2C-type Ser/Thr phosphatase [Parachlamydiales bacterium]|nr:Stp1/IreP family PP2C-type Ser/Thr phosphatase [Parachlamydiales bacterium]
MEKQPHINDKFILESYGLTDVGCVRKSNEDAWGQTNDSRFFSLADGMGGRKAGDIAAKQTISTVCSCIEKDKEMVEKVSLPFVCDCLNKAIQRANRTVYNMSKSNEQFLGMGCTICCLYFHKDHLIYGHVGDSRIYLLRNQQLKLLTQDDSLIAELLEVGVVSEEEAKTFPLRHVLTKCIGTSPLVDPTVNALTFQADDLFILCSDGLTNALSHEIIEKFLNQNYSLEQIANNLVEAAKQRGGYDNITVILLRVLKDE